MRRLVSILIGLVFLVQPCVAQEILGLTHRKVFTPTFVAPTFVNTTLASSGASSVGSITSPALTMTAGDFVAFICNASGGGAIFTASSTPAATWSALTSQNIAGQITEQVFYTFGIASGSTTFKCQNDVSRTFSDVLVLQYHPGSITTLDTQTGSTGNSVTMTSPSFSTTFGGLIIYCARYNNGGASFNPGAIGAATGTVRNSGGSRSVCEDSIPSTSQSTITAAMSSTSAAANWTATVGAFK